MIFNTIHVIVINIDRMSIDIGDIETFCDDKCSMCNKFDGVFIGAMQIETRESNIVFQYDF